MCHFKIPERLSNTYLILYFLLTCILLKEIQIGGDDLGFSDDAVVKNLPAHARDAGLIPGLGRSHGEGNGCPLLYSCLENSMDRGAWWTTVHGVANVGHNRVTACEHA